MCFRHLTVYKAYTFLKQKSTSFSQFQVLWDVRKKAHKSRKNVSVHTKKTKRAQKKPFYMVSFRKRITDYRKSKQNTLFPILSFVFRGKMQSKNCRATKENQNSIYICVRVRLKENCIQSRARHQLYTLLSKFIFSRGNNVYIRTWKII
jgi:hypothetical protein